MSMPQPDATQFAVPETRQGFDRDFVLYGHNDPIVQAHERAILARSLADATASLDTGAVKLARMRLDNLGRRVDLAMFRHMEGTKSKQWLVRPTCQACDEAVFIRAADSLLTRTQYFHQPLEPATAARCELRVNPNALYPEHSAEHGRASPRANRAAFYQPENVIRFIQMVKKILGTDYKSEIPGQILAHADRNKVWDKVHDPALAPFQLLALQDNRFDVTFANGRKSTISFMLDKQRGAMDAKTGEMQPGPVRLFAHFLPRQGQVVQKSFAIPALRHRVWDDATPVGKFGAPPQALRDILVAPDFARAQTAATGQQPLFPINKTDLPAPNFGRDRAGHEYIVVNHDTAHRLAPLSYAAISQGGNPQLAAQIDALIAQFQTPARHKKAATPTPISPRAA